MGYRPVAQKEAAMVPTTRDEVYEWLMERGISDESAMAASIASGSQDFIAAVRTDRGGFMPLVQVGTLIKRMFKTEDLTEALGRLRPILES